MLPGIRDAIGQRTIYFALFPKKSFNANVETFFDALDPDIDVDDQYKFLCQKISLTTSDKKIFYPIEFWGNLASQESAIERAAKDLGADIARFVDGSLRDGDGTAYKLSEITIKRL